jgi:hypothetical protein
MTARTGVVFVWVKQNCGIGAHIYIYTCSQHADEENPAGPIAQHGR